MPTGIHPAFSYVSLIDPDEIVEVGHMEPRGKTEQIHRIQKAYPDVYHTMPWLSLGAAKAAEQVRQELLTAICERPNAHSGWKFAGTKLFTHTLSPGCELCGQGYWSCLFINGVCNADCFYCPSEQTDTGPPITSGVAFDRARDYADYVEKFHVRGVGFSGGEPLLNHTRVTEYLEALERRVTRPLHTWMYTNGILATKEKIKALRDAGLKEIRFDLSANDYSLAALENAIGLIPVVTVEIPAIPEDMERMKSLIPDLYSAGVDYLNLHQIRCTPFNRPQLQGRGYTFLHGPGVTVLETELTALKLIRFSLEHDIPLPMNYCAFTFRHQFQKAGARHRNALLIKQPWEEITKTGYIRTLTLEGAREKIRQNHYRFVAAGKPLTDWDKSKKEDRLSFSSRLWPLVDFAGLSLTVTYSATALRTAPTYRYPFAEIRLNTHKKVTIERDNRHVGIHLEEGDIQSFAEAFLEGNSLASGMMSPASETEINRFETFCQGLAPYF
jgi:pyruvate formate-lyase activating enzyme-like uncharacterized protein